MSFVSPEFFLFFFLVVAGGLLLVRIPGEKKGGLRWFLIGASLFFFAWHDPSQFFILPGIAFLAFILSRGVFWIRGKEKKEHADSNRQAIPSNGKAFLPAQREKIYFLAATGLLLLPLFVYKYADFFIELAGVRKMRLEHGGSAGWDTASGGALPLGISFFTFQALSYLADVYRKKILPDQSWRDFLLYISFFPQLVAGPIVRAAEFFPQLEKGLETRLMRVREGSFLLLGGYLKKVVFADWLSLIADPVFESPGSYDWLSVWAGLFAFSLQIYLDFSGYTDIARGLAAILGIDLPENFRFPYSAKGFRDFWRRWHITLSAWLRDHIYIPLGGSRSGPGRMVFALMSTMVLGGIWHGAHTNFLWWGAAHGLFLILERWIPESFFHSRVGGAVSRIYTFIGVILLWIPFRTGMSEGGQTETMIAFFRALIPESLDFASPSGPGVVAGGLQQQVNDFSLAFIFLSLLMVLVSPIFYDTVKRFFEKRPIPVVAFAAAILGMWIVLVAPAGGKGFVYFVF